MYKSGSTNYCLTKQCFAIIDSAWRNCKNNHNRRCYENFIKRYKNGKYINEAKIMLKKIEDEEFHSIKNQKYKYSSYKKYINDYPIGRYVKEARRLMKIIGRGFIKISDINIKINSNPLMDKVNIKKLKQRIIDDINKDPSKDECWDNGTYQFCYKNRTSSNLCNKFLLLVASKNYGL